jgi:hypothetical protein
MTSASSMQGLGARIALPVALEAARPGAICERSPWCGANSGA